MERLLEREEWSSGAIGRRIHVHPGSVVSALLAPDRQNNAKTRLAAHHVVIGVGDALQRERFVHRPHAAAHTEGERGLRIDGRSGIPALDRATSRNQPEGGHMHRGSRSDDQQRAVHGEAALHGAHGLAAGRRREDDVGAAQFQKFRRRIMGVTVEVYGGAQLVGRAIPCPCRARCRSCESPSSRQTEPRGDRAHPGRARRRCRPAGPRCFGAH